uniref:Uncharacterized protein n=1 Tax=viral metagenome TaxID=1070528 RepID=A0A6M3IJF3_9ZZZZ
MIPIIATERLKLSMIHTAAPAKRLKSIPVDLTTKVRNIKAMIEVQEPNKNGAKHIKRLPNHIGFPIVPKHTGVIWLKLSSVSPPKL